MEGYVEKLTRQARESSYKLARLTSAQKNKALRFMAAALLKNKDFILKENRKDLDLARKNNLKKSFIERLALDEGRIKQMSVSLREVAGLAEVVGKIISSSLRPNGIRIQKVRVPIGVVLVIFEARPNVVSDCAGLLFKTSNVGILRGGSASFYSNLAVQKVLNGALNAAGINFKAFFVVEKTGHKIVQELLRAQENIDLVIPRGGEALIKKVVEISHIPVIKHYKGVCHIFVDKTADIKKALKIAVNAKVQRPSVCNAVETILVHKDIAKKFLPLLKKEFDTCRVKIRADAKTAAVISGVKMARESDWSTEYLDLAVSIKTVKNADEAIKHINRYGSHHTESIITKNKKNAEHFLKEVDSACCFVNISTRFSDGYQFGLGAEIGISTDKLHARGPMGLEELTTYKWIGTGNGQIRK
ncbi:MAG: glutamate-5-semialdehyde dehydrogenase [Candidatus Omnitrophica bacterium]|nr:glutamate-5-semialdehyde dehydrogenase [Candidatus Omnitrophota bacterium]MDD5430074.1 glutamate-5-semialdehyde dehydrogenase [Candidatus Omnitrophota bacterium]